MDSFSPEQARQQLDEAAARAELPRTDAAVGAAFTGGVALLVAATLAAVTAWREHPAGNGVSMGVFAVALALLLWWHTSRVRISDRAWTRRYLLGFGLTMALYTGGIFWESFAFPGWAIFAPYCVLVAAPGVAAAIKMRRG